MLTRKTVLVLGAGASAHYGFPTGFELSEIVKRELAPGATGFQNLVNAGIPEDEIIRFRNAFYKSGRSSVDAFLEHRKDLLDVGRLAIAATLIPREYEERLFDFSRSWLRDIYKRMNTSFDQFQKNALSVITYNYDRSVENFFMTSLQNSYKKSEKECLPILNAIPIIHLHGTLGPLPWQAAYDSETRKYEQTVDRHSLQVAMSNIKIIHEDIKEGRDEDFKRAKQLLESAEQIFFMGFGYDPINLERLGIADLDIARNRAQAIGTCVGMAEADKQRVNFMCNQKIALVSGDCCEMITERIG